MKALKATLAIMIIALVAISFGCSKKKATEPVVTPPASTTVSIPAAQQPAAASSAASNVSTTIGQVGDMASSLTSGSFTPKGLKSPPANWTLGSDGWYVYTYGGYSEGDSFKLKFTPNIWAGSQPYPRPGKMEYKWFWNRDTSYSGTTTQWRLYYYGMGQYHNLDTLATIVEGTWLYNFTYNIQTTGYSMNLSYGWNCNYDNVSLVNDQMHFTYTCQWPFVDELNPAAGVQCTNMTGEMSLNASGYGNLGASDYAGWTATNGTIFVKYYIGSGSRYYTLLSENWATNHTW